MKTTEELLRERFHQHAPALPEGFALRHDRLLHRLITGKEEPYMRKQRLTRLALVAALVLTLTGAALAAQQFVLFDLMGLYGHQQADMAPAWQTKYEPKTFETKKVRATVQELLSDGRGWYASFRVESLDEAYTIMPNFAEPDEPVAGPVSTDAKASLSFEQLAERENRRLLRVGFYVEATGEEEGFFEYFGTPDGQVTIVAGGYGQLPDKDFEAALRILAFATDPQGNITEETREDKTFPITVPTFGEKRVAAYLPDNHDISAIKEVILTQTPLTTYADFVPAGEHPGNADYELLDAQGNPYPQGFTLTGHAYKLDSLPDKVQVRMTDYANDGQQWVGTFMMKP